MKDFHNDPLFIQAKLQGLLLSEEPQLKERSVDSSRIRFEISDLFCSYCQELIEWVLKKMDGVEEAVVDYATDLCIIDYDPRKISIEEIFSKIRSLGYQPQQMDQEEKPKNHSLSLRFGVAAFFALNIMMFSYPIFIGLFDEGDESWSLLFAWISFFSSLPILGFSALPIFKKALQGLIRGFLGMELLVTISVLSSFLISTVNLSKGSFEVYFDTSAVIVAFVLLGKLMELKAKTSAKTRAKTIFRSIPKKARVRKEQDTFILIKDLTEKDLLISFSSEKIAVDGIVMENEALLDQSLITGESTPVFVQKGDFVKGGSILLQGWIGYRKRGETSTLETLATLIESSLLNKKRTLSEIDRITKAFVPSILFISLLFFLLTGDFEGTFSILLISCPCSIGIAVPLAQSTLIEALLSIGILTTNRNALKNLGKEAIYIFDKTGTLTSKEMSLKTTIIGIPEQTLSIIKTLCNFSIHPVTKSLQKAISVPATSLNQISEVMGKGMKAEERYFLGSPSWIKDLGGPILTSSLVFWEKGNKGVPLDLEDDVRKEISTLLKGLKDVEVHLLSGDKKEKTKALAETLGISHYEGELLPQQKKVRVEELKRKGITAFVGDGMNDAAALASADLSFAPLQASELSQHSSDFLLLKDDLSLILSARELGRKGEKILKQNLFWAFFYNVIGIPIASAGFLNPLIATIFMMVSSLLVLFNAKRITIQE